MLRITRKIRHIIYYLVNRTKFKSIAYSSDIHKGVKIDGMSNISLGEHVIVQRFSWLGALPLTGEESCSLEIEEGCVIGNFNHIYATHKVRIGKNVLLADRVYISDCSHSYKNVDVPIVKQPIKQLNDAIIDNGAWIGENVCIIGCKVGKNSVVGANSVVTSDIPDYCVAVGSPAHVIKKYNIELNRWEDVERQ